MGTLHDKVTVAGASTGDSPAEDVRSMRMLDPDDVAEAVTFSITRPRHVNISEIRINPSHLH